MNTKIRLDNGVRATALVLAAMLICLNTALAVPAPPGGGKKGHGGQTHGSFKGGAIKDAVDATNGKVYPANNSQSNPSNPTNPNDQNDRDGILNRERYLNTQIAFNLAATSPNSTNPGFLNITKYVAQTIAAKLSDLNENDPAGKDLAKESSQQTVRDGYLASLPPHLTPDKLKALFLELNSFCENLGKIPPEKFQKGVVDILNKYGIDRPSEMQAVLEQLERSVVTMVIDSTKDVGSTTIMTFSDPEDQENFDKARGASNGIRFIDNNLIIPMMDGTMVALLADELEKIRAKEGIRIQLNVSSGSSPQDTSPRTFIVSEITSFHQAYETALRKYIAGMIQ